MKDAQIHLEVREIEAKSILHKFDIPKLPFRWGANPYRGCQHDCWYCYARVTHEYLKLAMDSFQHVIFAKLNAPEVLRKELKRKSWKRELVNLGTVTDPYQPIERKYRITRRMLQVFRECKTPVVITTKSHHILDDLDLLAAFAQELFLNVCVTITTTDEELKRKLEPTTCSVKRRFETVERLVNAGITVGVVMSPVFPALTDSEEEMRAIAQAAADAGASYFIADILSMRASAREYFLPYMKETFPDLLPRYQALYTSDYPPRELAKNVRRLMLAIAAEYGVDKYDRMLYTPPADETPHQLAIEGLE